MHRSRRIHIVAAVLLGAAALVGACDDRTAASGPAPDAQGESGLLPRTTKGYEMWAWEEAGVLWFTLVTGTNRAKTVAEVTQKNVETIRGEQVHINRSGWDQLAQVLARVPPGSFVEMPTYLSDMPPLSDASRARMLETLKARQP